MSNETERGRISSGFRPDTPNTWDTGACVIYLIRNELEYPAPIETMSDWHYERHLRTICKRHLIKTATETIEAARLPNQKALINDAIASVHASICSKCGSRVPMCEQCPVCRKYGKDAK